MEEENKVNLSAFKIKLEVAKTKVSPRLDLILAGCPATSQAEKGGSYTHEAQLTSYVIHNVRVSLTRFRSEFLSQRFVKLQTFRAHTTCNSED